METAKVEKRGKVFKEHVFAMSGSYGFTIFDSFNYLFGDEILLWGKICETAFKTTDPNGTVYISERWMRKHYTDTMELEDSFCALKRLCDIGYITCDLTENNEIAVNINWETIESVIALFGNSRSLGTLTRFVIGLDDDSKKAKCGPKDASLKEVVKARNMMNRERNEFKDSFKCSYNHFREWLCK